ncbi:hypothetical protein ABPG72_013084 [Tetrahymena utriculariae]
MIQNCKLLILVALVIFARASDGVCDEQGHACQKVEAAPLDCLNKWYNVDDSFISNLIFERETKLKHNDNQVEFILQRTRDLQKTITVEQVIILFDRFFFSENMMIETLKGMYKRLHPASAQQIVKLLELFEDPVNKFEVFTMVVHQLMEVTFNAKNIILESLPNCYQEEAKKILEPIKEYNCLFGTLKGDVIAFVISPYNMGNIIDKNSNTSVLDYVKAQLKDTMLKQLKNGMRFNIFVSLPSHCRKFNIDYIEVTQRSLNSAFKFINDIKIEYGINLYDTSINSLQDSEYKLRTLCLISYQYPSSHFENFQRYIQWLRQLEKLPYHSNIYFFD